MSSDPNETWTPAEREIMRAAYRTLLARGYADLSMAGIAEELDKSKAAPYYYYDSKDELLVALLDYTIDRFEETIETDLGDDPRKDLDRIVEKLLPLEADERSRKLQTVLVGLRAQAVERGVPRAVHASRRGDSVGDSGHRTARHRGGRLS